MIARNMTSFSRARHGFDYWCVSHSNKCQFFYQERLSNNDSDRSCLQDANTGKESVREYNANDLIVIPARLVG